MWQGIDKRRFPRVNYPCKVAVVRSGQSEQFLTRTENIGSGGVCVILSKSLDKFCPVELTVYLNDGHPPLESDGRVVWVVKHKETFDTGVEFINIKKEDVARIERIVQECLKTR